MSLLFVVLKQFGEFFNVRLAQTIVDSERVHFGVASRIVNHFLPGEGAHTECILPNVDVLAKAVAKQGQQELVRQFIVDRQEGHDVIPLDRLDLTQVCLPERLARVRHLHLLADVQPSEAFHTD